MTQNSINNTASSLSIGVVSPSADLHIKAGTATAGTAPVKLTSGTLLTAPEAGAIEYDGTNLYYTDSVPTRQTIATVQPKTSFSAYLATTATNATGDGTTYTVAFDATLFNVNSGFNTSTGTFTAPATGNYVFGVNLTLVTSDAAITQTRIIFYKNGAPYVGGLAELNPQPLFTAGNHFASLSYVIAFDLAATNTVTVVVQGSNGAKDMSILGGSSFGNPFASSFYGFQVS